MTADNPALAPSGPPKSGTASVWRNRDFRLIWLGQTFSDAGTGISQLAYPLLVLALTGSPVVAGLVSAARAVPYLLLGLVAGALVDRWNRKRVMIICDVCRAVSMASIPIALWLGGLTVIQVVVVAFVGGTFYVFFSAAEEACLPNVVRKAQLTSAVSAQETSASAVNVVAPPLGGSLLAIFRGLPFLVDALSFAASAVCLSFVRTQFQRGAQSGERRRLRSDVAEGLRWLWGHPVLRLIAVSAAGLQLAISGVALVVIMAAREQGASAVTIGLLFSAVGIGGVIGAVIAPRLKSRFGFGRVLLAVVWAHGAFWLLLTVSSNLVVIGLVLVLFTVSMPIFGIAALSYRLAVTPDHLRGRVGTAFSMLIWGATPIGAAAAGVLLDRFGPATTSLVFGGWVAALSAVASLGGRLRDGWWSW